MKAVALQTGLGLGEEADLANIKDNLPFPTLDSFLAKSTSEPLQFTRAPFLHQLYILYTRGTIVAKVLVHNRFTIIRHKENLPPPQLFLPGRCVVQYSSTAWALWNHRNRVFSREPHGGRLPQLEALAQPPEHAERPLIPQGHLLGHLAAVPPGTQNDWLHPEERRGPVFAEDVADGELKDQYRQSYRTFFVIAKNSLYIPEMKNDAMNDLANGTPPGFGYRSKINRFAKYVARANFNRICRIGDTPGVLLDPSTESVLECLVVPASLLGM